MSPIEPRQEWVEIELTRAGLAVIEEGRRHKWGERPRETTHGTYLIRVKPQLAQHFKEQALATGRTASQIIVQAYVEGNRPSGPQN